MNKTQVALVPFEKILDMIQITHDLLDPKAEKLHALITPIDHGRVLIDVLCTKCEIVLLAYTICPDDFFEDFTQKYTTAIENEMKKTHKGGCKKAPRGFV